jgi:redox-sensitive bicupin YhaK (pirin superfamily)
MAFQLFPASARGKKDIGWLQSNFTFSFSSHYNPLKNGFGLLRVFNDDFVEPGKGFGIHPHTNMEIISIMLAGQMNHKDSMGYSEVVEKDWVQIMSAGSGLRHEEYNVGSDTVNFLQIWIEPKLQNITPRYQRRLFNEAARKNRLTTVVSNEEGQEHCWINQNAKISLGFFDATRELNYALNPLNKAVFIFSISGSLTINDQNIPERDAIGFWEMANIQIKTNTEARFIIIEAPINH